jgi:hypothetical protein
MIVLLTEVKPVIVPPIVPNAILDFSVKSFTMGLLWTYSSYSEPFSMILEPRDLVVSAAVFT